MVCEKDIDELFRFKDVAEYIIGTIKNIENRIKDGMDGKQAVVVGAYKVSLVSNRFASIEGGEIISLNYIKVDEIPLRLAEVIPLRKKEGKRRKE